MHASNSLTLENAAHQVRGKSCERGEQRWLVSQLSGSLLAAHIHHPKCCFPLHRALVQPTLTSALQGWGVGSLQQDADDLLLLTKFLKAEHASEVSFSS